MRGLGKSLQSASKEAYLCVGEKFSAQCVLLLKNVDKTSLLCENFKIKAVKILLKVFSSANILIIY